MNTAIWIAIGLCILSVFISVNRRKAEEPKTYLFFDTETTGLPKDYRAPVSDVDNWPHMIQLGWILTDAKGTVLHEGNEIIKPIGFKIPEESSAIHGISQEKALAEGKDIQIVLKQFIADVNQADCLVGHNVSFDLNIVGAELIRLGQTDIMHRKASRCTMRESTDFCKLPPKEGSTQQYKYPKLQELHKILFGAEFEDAHDAFADITATKRCFFELKKRGVMK